MDALEPLPVPFRASARGRRPLGMLRALEARHRHAPDATAVWEAGRSTTAAELFERAGGVAAALHDLDPDGHQPVAVVVERSARSVAALLGVLLAGRAYVPIEPGDPADRRGALLARLGSTVAVWGVAEGPPVGELPVVRVDDVRPQVVAPPDVDADAVGAVVFTSGSTGRPKGVVYDAAVLDALPHRARNLGAAPDGRVVHQTSMGFVTGSLPAACDATLALAPSLEPAAIIDWLVEQRFSLAALTPSLVVAALAGRPPGGPLGAIDTVATFGEQVTWEDVALIRRAVGEHVTVRVQYGGTEGPLGAMVLAVEPGSPLGSGPVPLGEPGAGTLVRLEPVPDDGPTTATDASLQELLVGGPLAPRYWDEPPEVARRLFTDADGVRWWRTGDLAARGADGLWHHTGRIDDLVKIHGRLTSPAEAERALAAVPGVQRAAVLAQPLGTSLRLVGHVEPVGPAVTAGEVHAALRRALPRHLRPGALVRHDQLPRSWSDKVDRSRLAEAPVQPWRDQPLEAPADAVEWVVASAVAEVLGLDVGHIGRHDDVFDLGLDSLGAVELVDALARRRLVNLTAEDLVACPTPATLARRVIGPRRADGPLVLNATGTRPPLWFACPTGSTALRLRWLLEAVGPDQPVVVFEAPGVHDARPPAASFDARAEVHVAELLDLRTSAFPATAHTPVLMVGHSQGALTAHAMAMALHRRGVPVRLAVLDGPLGEHGPLGRFRARVGDLRRARVRGLAEPGDLGALVASDTDLFDALDVLRRSRSLADALRDRPFGRPLPRAGGGPRAGAATLDHYLRHRVDGLVMAIRYAPRPGLAPDLVVLARDGTADRSWARLGRVGRVERVDATHNGMLEPPAVEGLAALLRGWADEASADAVGERRATRPGQAVTATP